METYFALFLLISLLTVFSIDATRKRRELMQRQNRA
jgi:hypothetical protein